MFVNKNSTLVWLNSLVIFGLFLLSNPYSAMGQPPVKKSEKSKLMWQAEVDGFDYKEKDDGKYYVNISGALNPKNGKRLDGTHTLEYYCQKVVAAVFVTVVLAKGYAESVLKCKPDERPFLWLYLNLGS